MVNGARIAVGAEEIEVAAHFFRDDGSIPNNPTLPLLLYPGVLRLGSDPAADCEAVFAACGWGGMWRNGIYSYHHYHSTAHEALAIARGEVRVRFGGENGIDAELRPGDVALIPAGVGHKNLGATRDLLVVGAYPPGQTWDLLRGDPGERPWAQENIARVPLPANDPVYGPPDGLIDSPMHAHWVK